MARKWLQAKAEPFLFITFDTATGRVSGNSGCNRMMGSFDVKCETGKPFVGRDGGYEDDVSGYDYWENVLGALAQVKDIRKPVKIKCIFAMHPIVRVVVPEKKEANVKLSVLNGEWKIKEANGEAIPSGMEKHLSSLWCEKKQFMAMPDVTW